MKILFLTKYSYLGASSRYRTYKYLPYFEKNNIECVVKPLFDDKYVKSLENGTKNYISVTRYYMKRFFLLFSCYKYDLIYIHIELFPYVPSLFEYVLKICNIKYISDYDDAIFHNYDLNANFITRFLLKNKIKNVIKWSSCVITGSPYLTNYALKYNKYVIEIPTSIDLERYKSIDDSRESSFTIGWIGSPSTSKYIIDILPALILFSSKYNCKIILIGFDKSYENQLNLLPVKIIDWNEETEINEMSKFSVGIMPLSNDLWSQGKCGFKLIQYMGCEKPTISTPLETNVKINRNSNNLFANNIEEWFETLENIFLNEKYFQKIGYENKLIVEKYYSIDSNSNKYVDLFNQLIKK